jgi:CRP-like cAMP-binding protein/ActR/RegA family two-component response regulator
MAQKILIIEDNPSMLENIADIVRLANYEPLTAPNGKLGVEMAKQLLPDLILCDIMMPELDGYGVFYILHKDAETANIPFVFLTAKSEQSDFREGMNMGADDYVTKPFESFDLLKVIETRLRKNEASKVRLKNELNDLNTFLTKAKEQKGFEKLSASRPIRNFKKKEFIFMEGQTPTDLFFISKGEVKTYKSNYEGKELITGIHHEGDFLGYAELLQDIAYNENAVVLEDAEVSMINKQDFLTILYSNSEVAKKFIKLLSNNQIENENRLLNLAYQSVRQRVAGALLQIQNSHPQSSDTLITIARKDIASIVGTATESLNRTIADFEQEGLIEIVGHGLRILNKPKLERILK